MERKTCIVLSASAFSSEQNKFSDLVKTLKTISLTNDVLIVSNRIKPHWFDREFSRSNVQFSIPNEARQRGKIISDLSGELGVENHDIIVLMANDVDMQMGKNGGATLVAPGWIDNRITASFGNKINTIDDLKPFVELVTGWVGSWWYTGTGDKYNVYALADLSSLGKNVDVKIFASKITDAVKNGTPRLNALLAATAKSISTHGFGSLSNTMWGVYPSSSSDNLDNEVLSDFCHRLRTSVSRVRFAQRGCPLFLRHTASVKRSKSTCTDRTNPLNQIETIHLNPEYKKRIKGRDVIVLDDCATYGVSFAVASAFLKKAGANRMYGLAGGKFGNCLEYFDIEIKSDPFLPVSAEQYVINERKYFEESLDYECREIIRTLIP